MTKLTRYTPETRSEFLAPFDSLFDQFLKSSFPNFEREFGFNSFGAASFPKVDVIDLEDKIQIEAEIPGMNKEDVKISIKDGMLCISGEKKKVSEESNEKKKFIMKELKHSSFRRSFQLNESLDSENVNAKFENGILTIAIPKKEPEKQKLVEVKID